MAVEKPTTTSDVKAKRDVRPPTLEEQVAQVVELTDPGVVAKVDAPGYVKVKSPAGAVTDVPEGIVQSLLDSGYTKSK